MAKNKPTEERVPGQGTILSQETVTKMQDLTEKVDSISGKVGTGVIAAKLALDGIGAVRTAFNDGIDGPLYDAIQDLKRQAKDKAITRGKEEIPTNTLNTPNTKVIVVIYSAAFSIFSWIFSNFLEIDSMVLFPLFSIASISSLAFLTALITLISQL